MNTNDEKFISLLDIVDVTNEHAFRDAMTELSLELINAMDKGKIETDSETMGLIQGIILLSLASNNYMMSIKEVKTAVIH